MENRNNKNNSNNNNSKEYNNFRGQVKVSEIQERFNNLVTSINNMIDSYNQGVNIESGIDFNIGSAELAAPYYTLSVGGLKQVIKDLNGYRILSKVIKQPTANTYFSTPFLRLTYKVILSLGEEYVATTGCRPAFMIKSLYGYNQLIGMDDEWVPDIKEPDSTRGVEAYINPNSNSLMLNTLPILCRDVIKIKSGNTVPGYFDGAQSRNTNTYEFVSGSCQIAPRRQTRELLLLGQQVEWYWSHKDGSQRTYTAYNTRLFVPKGRANPYTAGNFGRTTAVIVEDK